MNNPETPSTGTSRPGSYDFLFNQASVIEAPAPEGTRLPELDERQRQLFAAVGYPEEASRIESYDFLFNDSLPQPEFSVNSAAVRNENDRKPTENSILAATAEIVDPTLDKRLQDILRSFASNNPAPREVAAKVHSDSELRYQLARFFLAKIYANLDKMPHRIAVNQQKNPNHLGYPRYITSREYAALLAISMLDGSFKQDSVGRGDDITYTRDTRAEVVLGQHRAAANLLLHEL